jgi:hypothetical protein
MVNRKASAFERIATCRRAIKLEWIPGSPPRGLRGSRQAKANDEAEELEEENGDDIPASLIVGAFYFHAADVKRLPAPIRRLPLKLSANGSPRCPASSASARIKRPKIRVGPFPAAKIEVRKAP